MSSSSPSMSGAHKDVQRRVWDKAEYEARAKEREAAERAGRRYKTKEELEKEAAKGEQGRASMTDRVTNFLLPANEIVPETDAFARHDMQQYNFKDMVGQRRVVTAENALSEQAGFYCKVCDYLLKDQKSYYEHCNKPQHLKRMGLPSEVKRSGTDEIRARLLAHKQKDAAGKKKDMVAESKKRALEKIKAQAAAAKKTDEPKKQKKQKKEESPPVAGVTVEALEFDAAAMGLPTGFGSS